MRIREKYEINSEWDIIDLRRGVRKVCSRLGFDFLTQAYIVHFISELCQKMKTEEQAGVLSVEAIMEDTRKGILITAVDRGLGIENLTDFLLENNIYEELYDNRLNVLEMRRWFDEFEIASVEAGILGLEMKVVKWVNTGE